MCYSYYGLVAYARFPVVRMVTGCTLGSSSYPLIIVQNIGAQNKRYYSPPKARIYCDSHNNFLPLGCFLLLSFLGWALKDPAWTGFQFRFKVWAKGRDLFSEMHMNIIQKQTEQKAQVALKSGKPKEQNSFVPVQGLSVCYSSDYCITNIPLLNTLSLLPIPHYTNSVTAVVLRWYVTEVFWVGCKGKLGQMMLGVGSQPSPKTFL